MLKKQEYIRRNIRKIILLFEDKKFRILEEKMICEEL
jgi:hypothetical protein